MGFIIIVANGRFYGVVAISPNAGYVHDGLSAVDNCSVPV